MRTTDGGAATGPMARRACGHSVGRTVDHKRSRDEGRHRSRVRSSAPARGDPHPDPRRGRGPRARRGVRVSATPTSTPLTATGRSSRSCRSSPATRASASSKRSVRAPATGSSRATASPFPGSAMRAAIADYCEAGWETLCESQLNMGYFMDGGVRRVREGQPPARRQGAGRHRPGGRRAAHLRRRDDVQGGQALGRTTRDAHGVWGAGGLGHLAMQYARAHGASVIAVDIHDDKLETARELGAEYTVNAATEDAVAAIKALGGADAAIVTAVVPDRLPFGVRRDGARRDASCSSVSRPRTRSRSRSSRPC